MVIVIELVDAAFAYDGPVVVSGASLSIAAGEMVGLVGPSGAGKTTLLRAVLGQLAPVRGAVRVDARRVGYVPQLETIDWNFPITVGEAVLLGLVAESGPWPWPRRRDRAALGEVLARLGITELRDRHLRSLSGGQQQRVFLARALIRRPDLLVLDEPTSGLDVRTRQEILDELGTLHADGTTIVLATHDLNAVATSLPRVVCVNRAIVADGTPDDVIAPAVLRATFGSDMIVFRHNGLLLTADAPLHGPVHDHHVHVHHGPDHAEHDADAEARPWVG